MEALAYTHLVLAQESPNPQTEPIGNSWNQQEWDAIFDTLDEEEEEEEKEE